MGNAAVPDRSPPLPAKLTSLLPPAGALSAQEVADRLGLPRLPDRPARPYVMLNMVSSADGRATIGGRSGPLGNAADRALFHALRTVVDAVMAGAGTVRTERYGPLVRRPEHRRARVERGLREQPLACIVSGRLALAPDIPLLASPQPHVPLIQPSRARLRTAPARVD